MRTLVIVSTVTVAALAVGTLAWAATSTTDVNTWSDRVPATAHRGQAWTGPIESDRSGWDTRDFVCPHRFARLMPWHHDRCHRYSNWCY